MRLLPRPSVCLRGLGHETTAQTLSVCLKGLGHETTAQTLSVSEGAGA